MQARLSLVALTLASCAATRGVALQDAPASPAASTRANRIVLYLGARGLDEDDYEPVDKQGTIGLEFVHEFADFPLGFEVGVMGSGDEDDSGGLDFEAATGEIHAGLRKTFGGEAIHPYVGAGLSVIAAEVKVSGSSTRDDESAAGYVHGGVSFDVAEAFFIGVDVRALFGSDLDIGGVSTDADYGQVALVLGFAF